MATRRDYTGNAVPTRLTAAINNSVTSFTINDDTGWPAGGGNGPFILTIDPDTSSEERCLVTTNTGGSLTGITRGYDDTSAVAHTAGADGSVIHSGSAVDLDEANRHVTTTTDDDHTQYMKADGTRHDLTARHAASTVIPVANPSALAVGDATAGGASGSLARADHGHNVPSASPVSVGTALAAGSSGNFVHSDHVHDLGAASIDALALFSTSIRPTYIDSSAPGTPITGQLWFDTTNERVMYYDGAAWQIAGGKAATCIISAASDTTITASSSEKMEFVGGDVIYDSDSMEDNANEEIDLPFVGIWDVKADVSRIGGSANFQWILKIVQDTNEVTGTLVENNGILGSRMTASAELYVSSLVPVSVEVQNLNGSNRNFRLRRFSATYKGPI